MVADEPLAVTRALTIPTGELQWTFSPTGGPGGQHANRSSTRVDLSFDITASPSLTEDQRRRLESRLGHEARVRADESRSQHQNRRVARDRMAALLREALAPPPRRRVPTKPSRGATRRRLDDKARRGETKRQRRKPSW